MSGNTESYVAIDVAADGRTVLDTFNAPHDTAASRRALSAAEGVAVSLWRGAQLVGRWRRSADRKFRRAPAED